MDLLERNVKPCFQEKKKKKMGWEGWGGGWGGGGNITNLLSAKIALDKKGYLVDNFCHTCISMGDIDMQVSIGLDKGGYPVNIFLISP